MKKTYSILMLSILFLFILKTPMAALFEQKKIINIDEAKASILDFSRRRADYNYSPIEICQELDLFKFILNGTPSYSIKDCFSNLECINSGLYKIENLIPEYSITECLHDAESSIDQVKKEKEAEEQNRLKEQEDKKQKEAEALSIKQAEEDRKQQALKSDLKSGKRQPETLEEALIAFDASRGDSLSSAPKIKPDGAFYGMPGKIAIAHDDDTFVGELVSDNAQQAVMSMLGINNGYAQYPKYYQIKIPQELKEYYYQNAKINGIFVFVGKYSANQQYTMVDGETGSMPVFEAVFFKMIY